MDSSQYRRFNIKDVTAGDDYAANETSLDPQIPESCKRRGYSAEHCSRRRSAAVQVKMACEVFDELGLDKNVIVGVAKGEGRKVGLERIGVSRSR